MLANTYRLQSELTKEVQASWRKNRKIALLHVQLMDQLITQQQSNDVSKLLDTPDEWLAPLREKINADPALASVLKDVGLAFPDSNDDGEVFVIYCNPVNDDPEPYEEFTLTFSGNQCIGITRKALYAW